MTASVLWQYNTVRIFELSLSLIEETLQIGSLKFYVLQKLGNTEAYLEPSQTFTMKLFAKIVNHFSRLTISAKKAPLQILDWIFCNKQKPVASLTILTIKQRAYCMHVFVFVCFYVSHLVTERGSHQRLSVKRVVFTNYGKSNRKTLVPESQF